MAYLKDKTTPANAARVDAFGALRHTQHDLRGIYRGAKATYTAATPSFRSVARVGFFFVVAGSATKVVRLRRIVLSGLTDMNAQMIANLYIYSDHSASGGSPVALIKVPHNAADAAASLGQCNIYADAGGGTGAPTISGNGLGGILMTQSRFGMASAVAGEIPMPLTFDFDGYGQDAVVLRGVRNLAGLSWEVNLAGPPTLSLSVTWTEE